MADFNYYPAGMDGLERSFRIVKPIDSTVWNGTTLVAETAVDGGDWADGMVELLYIDGLPGFPVNIPTALPTGEYDLLIFAGAHDAAVAADFETGFGFKWDNNKKCLIGPPRELLIDRVG